MRLFISLLIGLSLYAQAPSTIAMSAPPPSAPTNVSVQVVNGDNSTYYYWIVATYPIGKVITTNPAVASRAPGTFSGSKFVNVGWGVQTGASSYDVLRTTTQSPPFGTTSSAVATGLTITSFQDTTVSPSSYTLTPVAGGFNGAVSVDNTNASIPMLLWSWPEVANFPVNIITFSDGTTQNTAGGGGSGSPGIYTVVAFSTTPTFPATGSTVQNFRNTLTGNVSSSVLTIASGKPDMSIDVCQDGTGSRTFVWPSNVLNAPVIDSRANYCTLVNGNYDGTNLNISSATLHKNDWSQIPGEINVSQATGANITKFAPAAGGNVTITVPARTANMATQLGATTTNNCGKFDASGNLVDAGITCAGGGGGGAVPFAALGYTTPPVIAGATTYYSNITSALLALAIEQDVQLTFKRSGTFQNFCVTTSRFGTQPGDGALTLTVRKNGVDTTQVAVIPAGTVGYLEVCDVTHTTAISAGDIISVKDVNAAATASAQLRSIAIELQ